MDVPYQQFLDECMLEFAKRVLAKISVDTIQLSKLYISYRTDHPNVVLSSRIKERYPKEITIVIQYQFEDLSLEYNGFSITVSFDGIKERIYIPFNALVSFVDPSNGYSLKFNQVVTNTNKLINEKNKKSSIKVRSDSKTKLSTTDNIVVLDKFRKKTDKS